MERIIEDLKFFREKLYNGMFSDRVSSLTKSIEILTEYKDAEEQGLLIKLPCKVEETVWIVHRVVGCPAFIEKIKFSISLFDRIGKTVFLTKEEADEALEGIEWKD